MFYRLAIVLCIVSLALGSRVFAASPYYYLSDLGTVSGAGQQLRLLGRNSQWQRRGRGRTAGASLPTTGDPAIWSGGTSTDLLSAVSGATSGTFLGIDGSGDAVGRAIIGGNVDTGSKYAFYLPAGATTATILPVLNSASPYGAAYGISNNGTVAGYSTSTDAYNNMHAFVWTSAGESRTWAVSPAIPPISPMRSVPTDLPGRLRLSHQRQRRGWARRLGAHRMNQAGSSWICIM